MFTAIVWSLVAAGSALAQTGGRHVEASLVAEADGVKPGATLVVGLRLEMDPGWHTYWRNPGDAGLPTKVAWTLPPGFAAGDLQWPRPIRFKTGPLVSFGYEDEVLLPVEIHVPGTLSSDEAVLEARASWLECQEVCLPGKATLTLRLPVRSSTGPGGAAPLFEAARKAMPREDVAWRFSTTTSEGSITLSVTPPAGVEVREAYFYPLEKRVIDPSRPQAPTGTEGGLLLELTWHRRASGVDRLEGVLVATTDQGDVALAVDVPVEQVSKRQPSEEGRSRASSSQGGDAGLHSSR